MLPIRETLAAFRQLASPCTGRYLSATYEYVGYIVGTPPASLALILQVGRRALAATLLSYSAALKSEAAYEALYAHFVEATNMSDQQAASPPPSPRVVHERTAGAGLDQAMLKPQPGRFAVTDSCAVVHLDCTRTRR